MKVLFFWFFELLFWIPGKDWLVSYLLLSNSISKLNSLCEEPQYLNHPINEDCTLHTNKNGKNVCNCNKIKLSLHKIHSNVGADKIWQTFAYTFLSVLSTYRFRKFECEKLLSLNCFHVADNFSSGTYTIRSFRVGEIFFVANLLLNPVFAICLNLDKTF